MGRSSGVLVTEETLSRGGMFESRHILLDFITNICFLLIKTTKTKRKKEQALAYNYRPT